jgi:hypothetical protein
MSSKSVGQRRIGQHQRFLPFPDRNISIIWLAGYRIAEGEKEINRITKMEIYRK